jgi:hypothetical protein
MSVASGTLTDEWRAELLEFYGALFGWREIESLRLPDRLTILVGQRTYVNIRERTEPMICSGYEHFGVVVASGAEVDDIWSRLDASRLDLELEPLNIDDGGFRSLRFRFMLPLAVEVQFLPEVADPVR